jgi:hypothetical protein
MSPLWRDFPGASEFMAVGGMSASAGLLQLIWFWLADVLNELAMTSAELVKIPAGLC